jgi:hypothetical protein
MSMYHQGMRELQDRYGGRKVADRLEEHRKHLEFTEDDRALLDEKWRSGVCSDYWGQRVMLA